MNNYCWVEVSRSALRENFSAVRHAIDPSVKIMAVVKSNGYGHGLAESAKVFVEAGTNYLGVSTLEEGLAIRKAGIDLPILVFLPLLPEEVGPALKANLTLTACSLDDLVNIRQAAERDGLKGKVHLKVETGLGRLGFPPEEFKAFLDRKEEFGALELEGIYSHLEPFEDPKEVLRQKERFEAMLELCRNSAFPVPLKHLGASHSLAHKDLHYGMVRAGTVLYGQAFDPELQKKLKSAFTFKTRIVSLRSVKKGDPIGYGKEYSMPRDGIIATVPVGYYEGFSVEPVSLNAGSRGLARVFKRFLYQKLGLPYLTFAQVKEKTAPVVGRVSMNMCQLDVSRIEGVNVGDEVALPIRWVNANPQIARIYTG